jgi:hypothetical protein
MGTVALFLVGLALGAVGARLHARRGEHEPRAVLLLAAQPVARPGIVELVHRGQATVTGRCPWCSADIDTCDAIEQQPPCRGAYLRARPAATPIPGPGMRSSR